MEKQEYYTIFEKYYWGKKSRLLQFDDDMGTCYDGIIITNKKEALKWAKNDNLEVRKIKLGEKI